MRLLGSVLLIAVLSTGGAGAQAQPAEKPPVPTRDSEVAMALSARRFICEQARAYMSWRPPDSFKSVSRPNDLTRIVNRDAAAPQDPSGARHDALGRMRVARVDADLSIDRSSRVVDDGIMTAPSVSAGLDLALAIVRRVYGGTVAEDTARHVEYPAARIVA